MIDWKFSESPQASFNSRLAYSSLEKGIYLYHHDCFSMMEAILERHPHGIFDMIFADPPYFLSNGGITCKSGEMVSVNKGEWDQVNSFEEAHLFNVAWLTLCQKLLTPNGTLWVSGTSHSIHSVAFAMQQLEFKILNEITWEKPNPPPNLSCRYFTHSTETLIWAAKNKKTKHCFNYDEMREENGGKQMQSVWRFLPPSKAEKNFGKHPTQKPISLVERCIKASTSENDFILDPFAGSSTTGVAALALKRRFCGIEQDSNYINISIERLKQGINHD